MYGYYASGADSESTLQDNIQAFKRRRLLPRIMVDVGHVDTTFSLLGALGPHRQPIRTAVAGPFSFPPPPA